MNQGPSSGDSPEKHSFYAAPANLDPNPEFTIDDLRAIAEAHADMCGGPEYAAHRSDSAADKFNYSVAGSRERTAITFEAERDRVTPTDRPHMYHYNLRVEFAELIPEADRIPALTELAKDAIESDQFEIGEQGATYDFVKITHCCSVMHSVKGFEFHTEHSYIVDGIPIYYNHEGIAVVGIDYESEEAHTENDGFPIADEYSDEEDDEVSEEEEVDSFQMDPFAFLEQSFADSELARKLAISRKMYELIAARKPVDGEFKALIGGFDL